MKDIIYRLCRLHWPMLTAILLLLGIGVIFIYSAAYNLTEQEKMPLYQRQIVWAALGCACFILFALMDYHHWTRYAWLFYVLGLILLVLVFVPCVGLKIYGAKRWIQLAGMRFFQPAELMKLAFVIFLARLFGYPGRNVLLRRYVMAGTLAAVLPMLLILKQPDMGTALTFLPVLLAVMFAAGVPVRTITMFLLIGGLLAVVVISAVLLPPRLGMDEQQHRQIMSQAGISPYQRERILVFFDSQRDPLGSGWNKAQSQIAVGSGGLFGKGFLRGTQNILGFLPRTVTPTDFVFSVIAEEKGFAGAMVTLALFGVLIYGGMRAAVVAGDKMGKLLCVGIIAMLFCHIFINIAMTMGLMPITGIPLPFLSYGGTFMVSTMSALGIVQSVYIRGDWR